jgi:hypothetical protein
MSKTSFFLCALFLGLGSPIIQAQEAALPLHAESVPAPQNVAKARRAPPGNVVVVPKRFVLEPTAAGLIERTVQARTKAQSDNAGEVLVAAPRQIGLGREVLALKSASDTRAQLDWQPQADGGHAAALAIASPAAVAIRLGVRVFSLPDQAIVRVHAPGESDAAVFEGREILALIALNLAAGELDEAAHIWWSPTVNGAEAVLEIVLPAGVAPASVDIAVPRISHLFASALTDWKAKSGEWQEKISSCHIDVNCEAGWDLPSRATAYMEFNSGADAYMCTGTLLNDLDESTTIPWFLSANHCISLQSEASSLQTYWHWRSAACYSSATDPQLAALYGGATLLYNSSNTDTSFMRLNEAVPSVAAYAGWSQTLPALNIQVGGVHHPAGEKQKLSLGKVGGYGLCTQSGGSISCTSSSASASNHIRATWDQGLTEGGSSGSGLFDTQNKALIGTLHAGSTYSACSGNYDFYGRFDLPFNAKLHEYLASTPPARTLTVTRGGTGSGKVSGQGIDCGSDCTEQYPSGTQVTLTAAPATGSVFGGWSEACTGTATTCTITMDASKSVSARFEPSGSAASQIVLRDAIYLYNQPVYGAAGRIKTLAGYNCDVFQLLLNVQSGYTDLAMLENSVANSSATVYPDRINSNTTMFSYMLYKAEPIKTFALSRYLAGADSGQIGTVTIFGYCFSSRTDAKVLLHDRETGSCLLSNGQTRSCSSVPNTPPQ